MRLAVDPRGAPYRVEDAAVLAVRPMMVPVSNLEQRLSIVPETVEVTELDNGVTVLVERMAEVRSASVGLWVRRGARDDPDGAGGLAHFVEHMLFKGTQQRSGRDIAHAIDSMGGQLDAFTAHETACYYASVLDAHFARAFDLLADLVLEPTLDADDMERERRVVQEEIAEAADDPEDVLYERFLARFWSGHPVGRPILGTPESVARLTQDHLRGYVAGLGGGDLVVSVAGNVAPADVLEQVRRRVANLPAQARVSSDRTAPSAHAHFCIDGRRELEQAQLYVAAAAPRIDDDDRFAVALLSSVLGGGVSSRLFRSIREQLGLAYTVYATSSGASDHGHFWIGAATRPESAPATLERVVDEIGRIRSEPIPDEELARVKDHAKGNLVLALESSSARMSSLAQQFLALRCVRPVEDALAAIDAVTSADVLRVASEVFDASLSIGVLAGRQAAERLAGKLADGVTTPWGTTLCPEVSIEN